MLESEEAARRLGVKVPTLYAYVSRGMLTSHPSPVGRRSLFDVDDVEALARRQRGGRRVESRLATVVTSVTQLRDDGPAYRGRPAADLAATASFEEVAELLWEGEPAATPWPAATLPAPPPLGADDRMRWAVLLLGAGDPLRADLRPEAVRRAARQVVTEMVEALAPPAGPGGAGDRGGAIASRLAARLVPNASAGVVRGVNAALVLLADHELATSTVAVRVAASTRADLYDALGAGLCTLAGPLHGGASRRAYELLVSAERLGVERALNESLRWQGRLPGFGHTVYREGDPRTPALFEFFDGVASDAQRDLVRSIVELAGSRAIPLANVDLGLAAVTWATAMPPDAGRTIFTVARIAGWTAHYLEELRERPLRFRARALYVQPERSGPTDPDA
jgi:citrate synthase